MLKTSYVIQDNRYLKYVLKNPYKKSTFNFNKVFKSGLLESIGSLRRKKIINQEIPSNINEASHNVLQKVKIIDKQSIINEETGNTLQISMKP